MATNVEVESKLLTEREISGFIKRAYADGWELMFPPIYSGGIDRSNLMYRVVDKEFLCVFKRDA